jgi:hypothetical protein
MLTEALPISDKHGAWIHVEHIAKYQRSRKGQVRSGDAASGCLLGDLDCFTRDSRVECLWTCCDRRKNQRILRRGERKRFFN